MDMGIMTKFLNIHTQYAQSTPGDSIIKQQIQCHINQLNAVAVHCKNIKQQMNIQTKTQKQCNIAQSQIQNVNESLASLNEQYSNLCVKYKTYESHKNKLQQQLLHNQFPNYHQLLLEKLLEHKIFANKHYKTLEGNQAKKYRYKFKEIAAPFMHTTFYRQMTHCIDVYNQLMSIIGY